MNGFGEIPKYIRFDLLITFLGLLLIGSGWYFSNVLKINSNSTGILFILGIPITIWGLGEMYNNYKEGRDLK